MSNTRRFAKYIYGKLCLIPKFHDLFWKYRHIISPQWVESYITDSSMEHPHRKYLADIVAKLDCSSLIEFGSATGPNLKLFSARLPSCQFVGLDISHRAVEVGRKYFSENKIGNVSFMQSDLTDLEQFPSNQFDYGVTDALLIYIDNKRIVKLAQELQRICKKGLILVEYDDDSSSAKGTRIDKYWTRDYSKRFSEATTVDKEAIDGKIWEGNWSKRGKIVQVIF